MLNYQVSHENYISRAVQLALKAGVNVRKNPNVGAILVHNNKIIGEGFHEKYGHEHAEVKAMKSVAAEDLHLISESTLYVTLEPCNHHGKTPPCTDLILRYKIPKVVIGTLDPHEKMAGKSVELLRESGVEVIVGIEQQMCDQLILPFMANLNNRPYVMLKIVKSKDNFIGKSGQKVWLSNTLSTVMAHHWRTESDGIIIGTNTAITDNPKLNVRHLDGDNPKRFVIDNHQKIPHTHHLLSDEEPTVVITKDNLYPLSKPNKIAIAMSDTYDIPKLLDLVWHQGVSRLLVEGGAALLTSFIQSGMWDEAIVITTDHVLDEGIPAPNLEGSLKKSYQMKDNSIVHISNTRP